LIPRFVRNDKINYFFFTTYLWLAHYIFLKARLRIDSAQAGARDAKSGNKIESQIGARVLSLFMLNTILRWISYVLAVLALAAGIGLLIGDAKIWTPPGLSAAVISAAPLLLVGASFLILQPIIRPRLGEFLKNALLAATFLLWGAIQLMPRNATSMRLGNVVIALYVLDLAWVVLGTKISLKRN
jgi:hypothetical protein